LNVVKNIEGVTVGQIAPDIIVNADCLEAMKLIPDKSIDSVIADLPFGITACHWDSVIPFEPLWEQYKRIIKPNGAIALFGSQPFTSALVMSNPKWFKYEWIWDKPKASRFLDSAKKPMKNHENILVFNGKNPLYFPQMQKGVAYTKDQGKTPSVVYSSYKKNVTQNTGLRSPKSVIHFSNVNTERGLSPTQKPIPLIEYLIKTYSLENELILDNTAGSGTMAIAAINTNRRYICIEKDEHYFEVMRNRIANHDPNAPVKAKKPPKVPKGQLTLF